MRISSNSVKCAAFIAFMFAGQSSYADPISVIGLNVSMNEAQIKKELVERGFSCSKDSSSNLICEKPSDSSDAATEMNELEAMMAVIEAMDKAMRGSIAQDNQVGLTFIQPDTVQSIEIGCDIIGICTYPLEEAAQMLVDNVNVDTLQSRRKPQLDATGLNSVTVPRYCGVGGDGDLICIESSVSGEGTGPVYIYRENFGRSKPSFN